MKTTVDEKILEILESNQRMFLSTSVDGNSSGATVFYARDGFDLIFFTFNPTRKAEQIRFNPRVQAVIYPAGGEGIRGLQIEGECYPIKDPEEKKKAYQLVRETTDVFVEFMDDPFLNENKVVDFYRIKPAAIKYVDFYAQEKFQWKIFPENKTPVWRFMGAQFLRNIQLWMRITRAPFLTATLASVFIGAALAWHDLKEAVLAESWSWVWFLLIVLGASLAQLTTNIANDYFDHTSGADEQNKVPSPFNGGSRVIQAGLASPAKVLRAALLCALGTLGVGLYLNQQVAGEMFASTPLLWIGCAGLFLAVAYTADPFRLAYKGWGELSIAIGFGPLMVMGTHYVLTAPIHQNQISLWNWGEALLVSVPIALLVLLIVWMNQFQDTPADEAAGKRTWVVRTAVKQGWHRLERPLKIYKVLMIMAFAAVAFIALLGPFTTLGTIYAAIALLPLVWVFFTFRKADQWLQIWNQRDADRQKVPYFLLPVNASTIGIHFLTGLLISLAYLF